MDKNNSDDPIKIEFGYECDLHHFHPKDTKIIIEEFIHQAKENNLARIRLVHGKGKSVKKKTVLAILEDHPDVVSYQNDGSNWGATIIFL